jgi:hypothetical protein
MKTWEQVLALALALTRGGRRKPYVYKAHNGWIYCYTDCWICAQRRRER